MSAFMRLGTKLSKAASQKSENPSVVAPKEEPPIVEPTPEEEKKEEELNEEQKEEEQKEEEQKEEDNTEDLESEGSEAESVQVKQPPSKVLTQYKIHQLDWFDVESRVKMICSEMIKPTVKISNENRAILEREQAILAKNVEETDKLTGAVFYRKTKGKNIFHVMQDEITELKASQQMHEKTVTAQISSFERQVEHMSLTIKNHSTLVDGFQ